MESVVQRMGIRADGVSGRGGWDRARGMESGAEGQGWGLRDLSGAKG